MHTSFTGSTKKARQVNLQGRANVNPWGKAAGPASTIAQAQAERDKRALDRRRLTSAKNIQRVWRGHKSRKQKKAEWRAQHDQLQEQNRSLAQPPEDWPPEYLRSQSSMLLRFFDLWSVGDHERLLENARIWASVLSVAPAAADGVLIGRLGITLANATAVCDQVAMLPASSSPASSEARVDKHRTQTLAKRFPDESDWMKFWSLILYPYLSSLESITRYVQRTPRYTPKVFDTLATVIKWATRPIPVAIEELISLNAIGCIERASRDEAAGTLTAYPLVLDTHAELAWRLLITPGLYNLQYALHSFAEHIDLETLSKSIISRLGEGGPYWLGPQDAVSLLRYMAYCRRQQISRGVRSPSTIMVMTTLLGLVEPISEDRDLADPQSIDQFLADIAALPLEPAVSAKIMAKYALGLLRAFPDRAYDIRMRIFLNPTANTSSGRPLTSIQYFWQASQQTEIFRTVVQSQRNVLALLRPDMSTEVEQIGRPGLVAKRNSQAWNDDWRLILFFLEMYTSALKLMDDEEFFSLNDPQIPTAIGTHQPSNRLGKGSLPLADVVQMVIFLKNLAYTLYWNTAELSGRPGSSHELVAQFGASLSVFESRPTTQPDLAGLVGVNQSYLKGLTTGVLRMLHERDSRRSFLPDNAWLMTSQVDMTNFIPEVVHEEEKRLTLGDVEDVDESDDDTDEPVLGSTSGWTSRFGGSIRRPGQSDFVNRFARKQEKAQRRNQVAAVAPRLELLRNLPFFIPFETRVNIFRQFVHNDQYRRRNGAVDPHVWRMTVEHMELGRGAVSGRELLSRHTAKIHRDSVFDDAFEQFYPLGEGLKEPIYIKFFDSQGIEERGIDGGGVTKEFLTSITSQAFTPDTPGLSWFVENDQHYLHPNADLYEIVDERTRRTYHANRSEQTFEAVRNEAVRKLRKQYEFLGRVVGKCLYEGILIDVRFAGFFLLKWALTGGTTSATNETAYRPTLNDMRDMDPDIYHHLLALKNWTGSVEEDFGLNFTITDNMAIDDKGNTFSKTRELIPNGANTPVTNVNRLVYIDRFVRHRLQNHPKVVTDAFLKGLGQMIEPMWLAMFNQKELQWLIGGDDSELDLVDLRRNTELGGIYQRGDDPQDHPTIEIFWNVLKEMDDKDRREVLRFATSTPRAPLLGFSNLNPKFSIRDSTNDEGRHDLNRLPTSSTCVNQLKLPPYKSKAQMREKLLYAARSGAGFDLS